MWVRYIQSVVRSHVALLSGMFFFFNDTATTEIYTLSLHDALPISCGPPTAPPCHRRRPGTGLPAVRQWERRARDRKSTRLNSSHSQISYAVFCLKKKKTRLALQLVRNHARKHHPRDTLLADVPHRA